MPENCDAPDKQLRKIRHDMLNTIGVIKLELHSAKRHADEKGAETIDSVQEEVRTLQDQLDVLCDEARAMAQRSAGDNAS